MLNFIKDPKRKLIEDYISFIKDAGKDKRISLVEHYNSKLDYIGANLKGLSLVQADFSHIILKSADLSSTDLNLTKFFKTDLSCADISNAKNLIPEQLYDACIDDIIVHENDELNNKCVRMALNEQVKRLKKINKGIKHLIKNKAESLETKTNSSIKEITISKDGSLEIKNQSAVLQIQGTPEDISKLNVKETLIQLITNVAQYAPQRCPINITNGNISIDGRMVASDCNATILMKLISQLESQRLTEREEHTDHSYQHS